MADKDAYTLLIEHYRTWLFNLPDAELLMPMIEHRFTLEEARFLIKFPFMPHSMEALSEKLSISADELKNKIDPLYWLWCLCLQMPNPESGTCASK